MQYSMYCDFEASISAGVSREEVEEAVQPMLDLLGEGLGETEDYERSSDVWFDGQIAVASCHAYVSHDFPDAFIASCIALGNLANRPFKATLSSEDNNSPEPSVLEACYGPSVGP